MNPMRSTRQRVFLLGILIVALIGFIDAMYLTYRHYLGAPPVCSLTNGCELVTTSKYATIGPIPIALLGALYYASIIIGTIWTRVKNERTLATWLGRFTIVGFATSLVLVYLQLFVLHAICLYCMGSAGSSTALFIIGLWLLYDQKRQDEQAIFKYS